MSNDVTHIPGRIKSASKNDPYVAGTEDIYDDRFEKNQKAINTNLKDALINAKDQIGEIKIELSDRYTKEEVNNIVSRTPETDVIVINVPAESQNDIAAYLDANTPSGTNPDTGRSVRANKLYRVPGPDNTTFSEWAWDGTAYIMLDNKDYGIDDEPMPDSDNTAKSGGTFKFVSRQTYNTEDVGKCIQNGSIRNDANCLLTPFIDVRGTDGVFYFGGAGGTSVQYYHICCFNSEKQFINDFWWAMSTGRYINFERNTQAGASVRYVRATMYLPNIENCSIRDDEGNVLWEPNIHNNRNILDYLYGNAIQGFKIASGGLAKDDNFCCTPFIDVENLTGVWWNSEINNNNIHLCGFDANHKYVANAYWAANSLRWVDFGSLSIKYVIATMNKGQLPNCYIKDENQNILWSANAGNVAGKKFKIFSTTFQYGASYYVNNDNSVTVLIGKAANTNNVGWANMEKGLGEVYIYGDAADLNNGLFAYNVPNFNFLVARRMENVRYTLIIADANTLREDDILICYAASGRVYGTLNDNDIKNACEVLKSIYNSENLNYGLQHIGTGLENAILSYKKGLLVTPFVDVTGLNGIWYAAGISGGDWSYYHLCCYDENKQFISDYWWSMSPGRYIDFARSTEAGSRVKYVRAPMYIPNIRNCALKTSENGDVLWRSNIDSYLGASGSSTEDVPSYYTSYLEGIESKIEEKVLSLGQRNDCFFFFSDIHCSANHMQSGKLIGELMRKTNINKVVFGGDIIRAWGGRSEIMEDAAAFTKNWYRYIKPYGELYSVQGNHDLTIATSASDMAHGYTFPYGAIRNYFMGRQATLPEIHHDSANPDSIYFYLDNEGQKIRYIFVSTTDSSNSGNVGFGLIPGFHKPQSDFCYNAIANAPAGYGIVVIGHEAAVSSTVTYVSALSEFLVGFKNKRSVVVNGTTYDFSSVGSELLFMLAGHEHRDEVSAYGNVPYVTVCCDAAYQDYKDGQFGVADDYPLKNAGTIYEQTFDSVFIDITNRTVSMIRIGGGYDRINHFDVRNVSVGGSIQLQTGISNAEWLSCDGTGNTYDGSAAVGSKYTNRNTKVSVSNGTVTGISAGNAVVCARNRTSKQMELFVVNVV